LGRFQIVMRIISTLDEHFECHNGTNAMRAEK